MLDNNGHQLFPLGSSYADVLRIISRESPVSFFHDKQRFSFIHLKSTFHVVLNIPNRKIRRRCCWMFCSLKGIFFRNHVMSFFWVFVASEPEKYESARIPKASFRVHAFVWWAPLTISAISHAKSHLCCVKKSSWNPKNLREITSKFLKLLLKKQFLKL